MTTVVVLVAVWVYAETSPVVWTVGGGIIVAAITGAISWFMQRRTTSGSIETSHASDIWEQTRALLGDYKNEVVGLRTQVKDLNVALQQSLDREIKYVQRIAVLEAKVEELKDTAV